MRKKIYLLLGGLALMLVVIFLYKFLSTSMVVVDLTNLPSSSSSKTTVSVDNKDGASTTQVGRGNHTLTISTPCYEVVTEKFSTSIRSRKVIKPVFKEASAVDAAKTVLKVDETIFSIASAKYYGDCEWLTIFVDPVVADTEGFVAIARYRDGGWVVITEGTALYLGEDRPDAPEQLLIDLEGTIEE